MHTEILPKGHSAIPFPDKRQSDALREEDEFMQTHGGRGSRAIYAIVMLIESGFDAAWRLPAAIMKQTGRMRANGTWKPTSDPAADTARSHGHE